MTGVQAALVEALAAVRRGELVVMPTDTVYGLAADPFDKVSVDRLLTAKGRGRERPSGVLIGTWDQLDLVTAPLAPVARALAERFWPGALSLVVPQAEDLGWDLGETGGTVMVRMPADPVARELLTMAGPLAVSSANLHGEPPATTAEEAARQLGTRAAVYVDSGPAALGTPSTIVRCVGAGWEVLRLGAVSVEEIEAVVRDLRT
ncbi:threonylcarbamoyl-AMP synthase [Longispora fulva]|uniref:L-threonylcarbamoyladenylate synthase n=1 Tax=Longispora fulva TaxID=619741 RepID=A0A8J7GXD7_9ACTN|nr:L-threonylcarbamoyladenylate synthase [Longispora fulva]MBG6140819.1 tRNA threonylcarbamoyl adenosine modification protein (Sua5/YciO/YrdC/YwlC family) [Longispora fulva]GIG60917.1 threonylcarbamoyl-AMP synthase [Longispora fulva]